MDLKQRQNYLADRDEESEVCKYADWSCKLSGEESKDIFIIEH